MRGSRKYFLRGGGVFFLVDAGIQMPTSACPWWPHFEYWLGSYAFFPGSGPVLLRNHLFCDFPGGSGPPLTPLDLHMAMLYWLTLFNQWPLLGLRIHVQFVTTTIDINKKSFFFLSFYEISVLSHVTNKYNTLDLTSSESRYRWFSKRTTTCTCHYILIFNHISLVSFLWDIGKQCKSRSDATEGGVWSGFPLFVYRKFYRYLNKNEKQHPTTL